MRLSQTSNQFHADILYDHRRGDEQGPFAMVPDDLMEQAKLDKLNYQSPLRNLREKFHCSPQLLQRLNPDKDFLKMGSKSWFRMFMTICLQKLLR